MKWLILLIAWHLSAQEIVLSAKQIRLPECPGAFNPSMIQTQAGILWIFRYTPDRANAPWISYIGAVILNEAFEPISPPQLLTVRRPGSLTPSQSEDPRIFTFRGRTLLVFNDNLETENPSMGQRRDMYLTELFCLGGRFSLSTPIKLIHDTEYNVHWWQKNWFPFEWNNQLFFVYSISPHEILQINWLRGVCYPLYLSEAQLDWKWGTLRGSTPAIQIDGEYLAFFHSSKKQASHASFGEEIWHYFMGAYTFASTPPFAITRISKEPIVGERFYTPSDHEKRVIFPGGFIDAKDKIYVAYGKDDSEMWVATLDKAALLKSLEVIEK